MADGHTSYVILMLFMASRLKTSDKRCLVPRYNNTVQ